MSRPALITRADEVGMLSSADKPGADIRAIDSETRTEVAVAIRPAERPGKHAPPYVVRVSVTYDFEYPAWWDAEIIPAILRRMRKPDRIGVLSGIPLQTDAEPYTQDWLESFLGIRLDTRK